MKTRSTIYHTRWMIARDKSEVLAIEFLTNSLGWTEKDLMRHCIDRCTIGIVAERGEEVVGFLVYKLHKHSLEILNMAVHPEWQQHGVGTALIDKLKAKLEGRRRATILAEVPERKLDMQLFLREQGFFATPSGETYSFTWEIDYE